MTKTEQRKKQKRMAAAVASLQEYMRTYSDQPGYQDYSDTALIDDVLYGLGIALGGGEYAFADGFAAFKDVLRKHLTT